MIKKQTKQAALILKKLNKLYAYDVNTQETKISFIELTINQGFKSTKAIITYKAIGYMLLT